MAVIVFDVNETLLDLSGLDAVFVELFDDRAGELKRVWFARLLHTSSVMTQLGTFQDFGVIGQVVLRDHAARMGVTVTEAQAGDVVAAMRSLPPHPDAVAGIQAFSAAGHRVAALTNSGKPSADAQLTHAGLADLLEDILSVDEVQAFKPEVEAYRYAEESLGAEPSGLVMVACHDWDLAGAMKAGWRSAYISRPGTGYSPLFQPPTWQASDLVALAAEVGDARG